MTKTEWKLSRLDELGFVGRGKSRHRPRNDDRLYDGPYPFIQTAEIMNADPYITGYSQTYTEFGLQQSKLWPPNTLCMTIAGANTAETAILKFAACFPDSIVGFIPDEKKANLHFVKYTLDLMKDTFRAVTRGATQDNLSLDKLLSFPLPTPPLPVQRRIAGILSAYDELIENNQRRIRLLEEMARSLYREWFVHFRFPGNDKVKMVPSTLGPIPQGWEVKKLVDLTGFLSRGISPKYDDDGDSIVINQKCIREQHLSLEPARRQIKPISEDKRVRFGDVLINSTGVGTLGRVAQVYEHLEQCTVDTHVTIVRPNNDTDIDFFGCALFLKQQDFERLGIGATGQTELSRTAIGEVKIPTPPNSLQKVFGGFAHPIRTAAKTLSRQVENLRRTRDLLLPRLLSGQLDLKSMDAIA